MSDVLSHQEWWRKTTVLSARDISKITKKPLKSTYDAMKKGHFPTISIGRSRKVPTHLFAKMIDGEKA